MWGPRLWLGNLFGREISDDLTLEFDILLKKNYFKILLLIECNNFKSQYDLIRTIYQKEKIPSSTSKYILKKLKDKGLILKEETLFLTIKGKIILKLFEGKKNE